VSRAWSPRALAVVLLAGLVAGVPAARAARADAPGSGEGRASGRALAGSILAVVAVAAAGAGLYMTARVDRLARDIEQARALNTRIPVEQIDEKVAAGERAQVAQWVGYGVAAAAGVGAAVLLLWPERSEAGGATALPLVGPTVAGATLRLRF
jgi:hypothetical protein